MQDKSQLLRLKMQESGIFVPSDDFMSNYLPVDTITLESTCSALREAGVEPLSRKFIFENSFIEARNVRIPCQPEWRSLLSLLLHEKMQEKYRNEIFPGKFDLGSLSVILEKDCTYAALLEELHPKSLKNDEKIKDDYKKPQVEDLFKPIKDGIKRMTGRSMPAFFAVDKAVALKVVKLFYHIVRRRTNTIFSKLSPPEKGDKSGLEFREAYPNEKTEDLIWLVGDIKEYLGAELSCERLVEIQSTFSSLQSDLEDLLLQIDHTLLDSHGRSYDQLVSAYGALTRAIEAFSVEFSQDGAYRLDETLYVYLSSLEFRHYAQTFPRLSEVGRPKIKVPSLKKKLHDFAKIISEEDEIPLLKPQRYGCKVEFIPHFSVQYHSHFHELMQIALSASLKKNAVEQCAPYVRSLLGRVLMFDSGAPLPDAQKAPLPLLVAAFCAVQAEMIGRTQYKPYWHGQPAVGGSLLESLKSEKTDKSNYEEHLQIWRIRLYWFLDAINGHAELGQAKAALRLILFRRFSEIARITNTKTISEKLVRLRYYIREQCQKLSD